MSISRKNWSALSSLTRQWTVEDEEEVERERRRKSRSQSNTTDPEDSPSEDWPAAESSVTVEQRAQLDFMAMVKLRDERRQQRHQEALRRQQLDEEKRDDKRDHDVDGSHFTGGKEAQTGGGAEQEEGVRSPSSSSHQFVSSFTLSFDKSPASPLPSPASPLSPTRCSSAVSLQPAPPGRGQRGDARDAPRESTAPVQTDGNSFRRQNYRALSFRMRKKEEESKPLQRSASFRTATKVAEASQAFGQEEDKYQPLQRNSRQRISSRSIQEMMEKLTVAAQKSSGPRASAAALSPLGLADKVSRKRELFEREAVDKQNQRTFQQPSQHISQVVGTSRNADNLSPVAISSKKQLWEKRAEQASSPHQ